MNKPTRKLPTAIIDSQREREIAVAAHCDPRTVRAYLAGMSVRPMLAERIAAAFEARIAADKDTRHG